MTASAIPTPTVPTPAAAPVEADASAATTARWPAAEPLTATRRAAMTVPPAGQGRPQAGTAGRRARDDDRGQATAEYGLVILVAGLIALGVIAWVRDSSVFTDLFGGIIETLTSSV